MIAINAFRHNDIVKKKISRSGRAMFTLCADPYRIPAVPNWRRNARLLNQILPIVGIMIVDIDLHITLIDDVVFATWRHECEMPYAAYLFVVEKAVACSPNAVIASVHPSLLDVGAIDEIVSHGHVLTICQSQRMVLPNGPEMAIAFLAIAASATAAPLNPAYQAAEFDFYLEDLKPRVLIIEAGSNSPACQIALNRGIKLVFLTPNQYSKAGQFTLSGETTRPADNPEWGTPNDVGLVLHTSGTTSRPKIVPLTQANLCASAMNIAATLHLSKHDRVLNMMPMFHIHGLIAALLAPLLVGGSVACTSGFSSQKFFEYIDAFQPTWFTAVPTMHQSILMEYANQSPTQHESLRFIRSSSAALASTLHYLSATWHSQEMTILF